MRRTARLLLASFVVALGAACATNPVTGKRQITLMSEAEELALGQQADAEVRREMGIYDDAALQRYIRDIGDRLASASHRPRLPWSFAVVDTPAVNAFALPGGYVYITRGILAYLDDESELAGVLGHEIGHVTARHAVQAYTRAAQANIGLTILGVFVPGTRPFADLSASGLGILFLKNDREAELEADRLGVEYAAAGGWDPAGVPRFLATLARLDAMDERGVPNWLSTHPDPGSRVERAEPVAARFASASATTRNREPYLERIDGLVYGDNPKDGIVRGHVFLHPVLRIAVDFPEGWDVMNSERQVMAREPGTSHYMVLQEVEQPRGRSVEAVALDAMRRAGYQVVGGALETINGLRAYVGTYRGSVRSVGRVMMRAAHIGVGRQVYVVAGFAPEQEFRVVDREVSSSLRSFRELSRDEAARIRPNRLSFYIVRPGDTWQSIAARQGRGIVSAATLAIMNDHAVNEQPQPGERLKIVVEG